MCRALLLSAVSCSLAHKHTFVKQGGLWGPPGAPPPPAQAQQQGPPPGQYQQYGGEKGEGGGVVVVLLVTKQLTLVCGWQQVADHTIRNLARQLLTH